MPELKTKFCICFAGPAGSSKTTIAHYLSENFNLAIFSNDAIRAEVGADLGEFEQGEYEKRRDERVERILKKGFSFIYDASVDREWDKLHKALMQYDYKWFIISIDLTKDFLTKLYKAGGQDETLKNINKFITDHENFLKNHGSEVGARVTHENFAQRLQICAKAFEQWLDKL